MLCPTCRTRYCNYIRNIRSFHIPHYQTFALSCCFHQFSSGDRGKSSATYRHHPYMKASKFLADIKMKRLTILIIKAQIHIQQAPPHHTHCHAHNSHLHWRPHMLLHQGILITKKRGGERLMQARGEIRPKTCPPGRKIPFWSRQPTWRMLCLHGRALIQHSTMKTR